MKDKKILLSLNEKVEKEVSKEAELIGISSQEWIRRVIDEKLGHRLV
jgi:predicted HicB family RNase H-like nuclease